MPKVDKKLTDFVPSKRDAKSNAVNALVRTARHERWSYDDFLYVCQQARKKLKLKKPKRARKLPQVLPDADLKKFFAAVEKCRDPQHEIMLRLLLFTGIRVSELVDIKVEDVDFAGSKIFISEGKGSKDRYVLFPESFRLVMQSHLRANPGYRWLFETQRRTQFTTRRIQQIVSEYREKAGIKQPVHPHLFRHQMLTYLTNQGLTDAQIQLISGHASKKSLEVYQHISLESVEKAYQAAAKAMAV